MAGGTGQQEEPREEGAAGWQLLLWSWRCKLVSGGSGQASFPEEILFSFKE